MPCLLCLIALGICGYPLLSVDGLGAVPDILDEGACFSFACMPQAATGVGFTGCKSIGNWLIDPNRCIRF